MNRLINDEDIEDFLKGNLSDSREKEVIIAIESSEWLQDYIEATIDLDDMIFFEELNAAIQNSQGSIAKTNLKIVNSNTGHESKWSKYLIGKENSSSSTSSWEEYEYQKAANKGKKSIKIKSRRYIKKEDGRYEVTIWFGVIIIIIIAIITAIKL